MKSIFWQVIGVGVLVCLGCTQAFAQEDASSVVMVSSTSTSAVIITVGPFITTTSSIAGDNARLQLYLKHNAAALAQDMVTGGKTIEDLAQMFQVETKNYGAFTRLIRTNRNQLNVLSHQMDQKRTRAFFLTVFSAMKADQRFDRAIKRLQV